MFRELSLLGSVLPGGMTELNLLIRDTFFPLPHPRLSGQLVQFQRSESPTASTHTGHVNDIPECGEEALTLTFGLHASFCPSRPVSFHKEAGLSSVPLKAVFKITPYADSFIYKEILAGS